MTASRIDHPYYCNEGNYLAGNNDQPHDHYQTWESFMDAWGDSDMDYNFLFRCDYMQMMWEPFSCADKGVGGFHPPLLRNLNKQQNKFQYSHLIMFTFKGDERLSTSETRLHGACGAGVALLKTHANK